MTIDLTSEELRLLRMALGASRVGLTPRELPAWHSLRAKLAELPTPVR